MRKVAQGESNHHVLSESGKVKTMCNHSYIADFMHRRSMGRRCPYPEFYEKARSTESSVPDGEPLASTLPMDDGGACIFHSQEIAWKRKNDFKGKFLQLVQLLDAAGEGREYDFVEFVFVGSELRTKSGTEEHILDIGETVFRKEAHFMGASFLDSFELESVDFQRGANFIGATFARDLRIKNARLNGVDFGGAKFTRTAAFTKVEFLNFALFGNAQFTGTTGNGYTVRFEDSRFEGITDFSNAAFTLGDDKAVSFLKVQFEDFTDFKRTRFACQVVFRDVSFAWTTEFIDTSFETIRSSARYRGAAVQFDGIEVTTNAVLTFMSTDPQNKMFNHDVRMSFKEEPTGIIRFENVNFSRIVTASKDRLTQLAKAGRVEIGAGCIKYRFQTAVRTISVSLGNAPLIIEICQTFTNYFTGSNGLNLGFEIVDRDKTKVSFFYFTDEDISEVDFLERLADTEQSLWKLLSITSGDQLPAIQGPTGTALSTGKESAVINAVDGISALLGTFFRVGARIALGAWKEADTKALLGAIRFNDEGFETRVLSLHRVLMEKYTDSVLFGLNRHQNEELFLEGQVLALNQTVNHTLKLLADKGDTYVMRDNYEVSGQAGAVGPNAHVHDLTLNQIASQIENSMDLSQLSDELARLHQAMKGEATNSEHYKAIGSVMEAEGAAKAKDSSKVVESLKSAGKWTLDLASKIGASLATEAIKQSMGMK